MTNPWMIGELAPYRPNAVNVVVKDLLDIEGLPTTRGSRLVGKSARPAHEDSSVVARLRANGFHVRGKANLVEFAFGVHGMNPWYGSPVNPISPDHIPGGSSSGSAVAVALGEAEVGVGTDTGGSIRIPAACCGLFGLKPTHGLVDESGCASLAPSLDTIGVLARSCDDLTTGFLGIGGVADEFDIAWIGQVVTGNAALDARVGAILELTGLDVRPVMDVDLASLYVDATTVLLREAYRELSRYMLEAHRIDPRVRLRLEAAANIVPSDYAGALARRDGAREHMLETLGMGEGIFALPTIAGPIPTLAARDVSYLNRLTLPFNYLGFPALALPVRQVITDPDASRQGEQMPFSLQVVAADYREGQLLRAARLILKGLGAWVRTTPKFRAGDPIIFPNWVRDPIVSGLGSETGVNEA